MSDILVFSAPLPEESHMPMANAGLGVISGFLEEEGYDFEQRSLMAECRYQNRYRFKKDRFDLSVLNEDRVAEYLRGRDDEDVKREANKLADELEIDSYDIVLMSAVSDKALARGLPILKERAQDKLVVIGGPCTMTNNLGIVRLPFIDYGVLRDGEIPLKNILDHELEGEVLSNDTGLVYMEDGELVRGEPYFHPLEMKPKPYFEREIIEKFREVSPHGVGNIPYQFGRGCTQNCAFCNYFENQSFQYKSIDKVLSEIKELREETGTDNIHFVDSNLFNQPDYVERFAEEVIEREIEISWGSMSIILPRNQEFFDKLAEGGCKALLHGIESTSNSVLHRMHKAQTRSMIEETLSKESKAGIRTGGLFIVDYVDETWEEYNEILDFLRTNSDLKGANFSVLSIFSNDRMPLYNNSEDYGIEIDEPDYEDFIDECFEDSTTYRDSLRQRTDSAGFSNRDLENSDLGEMKRKHAERLSRYHIFVKNFVLNNPDLFVERLFNRLLKKNYSDYSWLYA